MRPGSGKLHIGFVISNLAGGGAERVILTLADTLIKCGHRVDLVMEEFTGDYRSGIPQGLRLYSPIPRSSNEELLAYCRERDIEVNGLTINPVAAAWTWLVLNRKYRGFRVPKKHAIYACIVSRYLRQARPQVLLAAMHHANAGALYASELTGQFDPRDRVDSQRCWQVY